MIKISTHGTIHMDAPWHYSPVSGGCPSRTIDQIPLEWFYGMGVVIDMYHKADYEVITLNDLEDEVNKINNKLIPGDIVLVRTDNDRMLGTSEYFTKGPVWYGP